MRLTDVANFQEKLCLHFVQYIENIHLNVQINGAPRAFLVTVTKPANRKILKIKSLNWTKQIMRIEIVHDLILTSMFFGISWFWERIYNNVPHIYLDICLFCIEVKQTWKDLSFVIISKFEIFKRIINGDNLFWVSSFEK